MEAKHSRIYAVLGAVPLQPRRAGCELLTALCSLFALQRSCN